MRRGRHRSMTRSAGRCRSMAHIPLIHGPDGAKLSKRHGALGVDAYRAMGYLPAAMRNYLVRLGWSHGDQEIFSTEEMIEKFDLPQVGRSPARFDFAKLESLNGALHPAKRRSRASCRARASSAAHRRRRRAGRASSRPTCAQKLLAAMPGLKERAKTLVELLDGASFLFADRPIVADEKAQALLTPEARALLDAVVEDLGQVEPWTARDDRAGGAWLCRAQGHQAWRRGAAVARRAHRPDDVARHLRGARRAGQRREVWAGCAIRPCKPPAPVKSAVTSGHHSTLVGCCAVNLRHCRG